MVYLNSSEERSIGLCDVFRVLGEFTGKLGWPSPREGRILLPVASSSLNSEGDSAVIVEHRALDLRIIATKSLSVHWKGLCNKKAA